MEPPLHGNQGNREPPPTFDSPLSLTIAITREAGARGGSIAQQIGKRLGWQVYTQDLLEFLSGNDSARSHVLSDIPHEGAIWADRQLQRLQNERIVNSGVELGEMPRLMLTLAARGRVVLVGRGAGFLLPRSSTLHVRVVAPLEDRVAYMAQWLRMTHENAAQQVRDRDEKRAEFLVRTFRRRAGDLTEYDMILNSLSLGEEVCAELIYAAVQGKQRQLHHDNP
jgi:hypothetical protein